MNVRRIRHWLYATAVTGLAGAGIVVIAAWKVPYVLPHDSTSERRRPGESESRSEDGPPSLAAFNGLWDRPLRQPLYDPPPPQAAQQPPPAPMIRLAGTVVEPGRSRALILTPDGRTEFKGIGERSGGVEILEIRRDGVTVLHGGERVVLKVEDEKKG